METILEKLIKVENERIDKYQNKNIEQEQQLNNIYFNMIEKVKNNKGYEKGQTYFDFL